MQPIQQQTLMSNDCFAVPGSSSTIDIINPATGRGTFSNETLEQVRIRYPGAERMSYKAWSEAKAARQDVPIRWNQCTQEHYNDMLNCLPPERMARGAFLVGEPADHHAVSGAPRYAMLRKAAYGWQESSRPVTVAEFTAIVEESR